MKIIGLTDIHGKNINFGKILMYKPDIIVVSGDITNFGRGRKIIDYLSYLNNNEGVYIITVYGNCDTENIISSLKERNFDISYQFKNIFNLNFIGIGGSNPTPFNTPMEHSEEEIYSKFMNIYNKNKDTIGNNLIVVSHPPPKGTMADMLNNGQHVGSASVRKIIEEINPKLVFCGHIHESRCIDKINDSYIINPSPEAFVVVDIDDIDKHGNFKIYGIEIYDLR